MSSPADDPQLTALKQDQTDAQAGLAGAISGFKPPENAAPATFDEAAPQDQFKNLVGLSPLLMALGAIGGKFGRAHGVAMIASTNAMMKGIVQGSADQYKDAREQYQTKYEQWRDQQRTWNDTYKAYMTAYKGNVDAHLRAVQGANAAVGIYEKGANMSAKQVDQSRNIQSQIDKRNADINKSNADAVSNRIKADSSAARAETAQKETDLKYAQLKEKVNTADANALTAQSRQLKAEADSILRQYPSKDGRPKEVDIKLQGLRDSMDLVQQKLQEHTDKSYNENKGTYDAARAAIKSGADPIAVKKRVAEAGLNPDNI